jgi:hypothetical protein
LRFSPLIVTNPWYTRLASSRPSSSATQEADRSIFGGFVRKYIYSHVSPDFSSLPQMFVARVGLWNLSRMRAT